MPKPKALSRGDTIAIVSPASPLSADDLVPVTELLVQNGYEVRVFPHALDRDSHLAGRDEDRARDLTDAFLDPEIDAILCSRGGYGCARLLPYLDFDQLAQNPKLFLGFSDVTTLHLALNRRGLPTIHAPMGITLSRVREDWVYESFLATLKGEDPIPPTAPAGATIRGGTAEGVVLGGCLCLLCDSIGTAEPLATKGSILIIEDVDEAPHRIDAMLTHLLNTNLLQDAAGVVFGEMTRTDEKVDEGIGGKPWREIVAERCANLNVPVVVDYPFGHGRNMLSLPLGVRARLDGDAGTLTYLESHCA